MRGLDVAEATRQGVAIAACGAAVLAARRWSHGREAIVPCAHINAQQTPHLVRHGGLAAIVQRFTALGDDEAVVALAGQVDDALSWADELSTKTFASRRDRLHWGEELNRAVGRACAVAREAVRRAQRQADAEERILACVRCMEEGLPALEGALDGVLHNALLAGARL